MEWIVGIAMAAALAVALMVRGARKREDAQAHMRTAVLEELSRTGLTLAGDPLDQYTLEGQVQGLPMALENRASVFFPAADGGSVYGCCLRFPVALPDLLVCAKSDVDRLLGPLPAARRVSTDQPRFDGFFALFLHGAPTQPGDVTPFDKERGLFSAETLEGFVDLGLQWMRVQEGRAELVFRVLDEHEVLRATRLAATIARRSPPA